MYLNWKYSDDQKVLISTNSQIPFMIKKVWRGNVEKYVFQISCGLDDIVDKPTQVEAIIFANEFYNAHAKSWFDYSIVEK